MLVLSRKESERLRIGEDIIITVVRVSGDRVRLGIEAPSGVRILRDELVRVDAPEAPLTGPVSWEKTAATTPEGEAALHTS